MFVTQTLLGLTSLLIAWSAPPSASQPTSVPSAPQLDPNQLQFDRIFWEEVHTLGLSHASVAQLLKQYSNDFSDDPLENFWGDRRELGFGGVLYQVDRGGIGYEACEVTFLVVDDRVAVRQLRIRADEGVADALFPLAREALKPLPLERRDNTLLWAQSDEQLVRKFRATIARKLGEPKRVRIPTTLVDAYDVLTSPLRYSPFGEMYGIVGEPPEGRVAMDALEEAGRYDLISNVLRGLNPEGRVYAAESLLKRRAAGGEVSEDDLRVIEIVRGLDVPISRCVGCVVLKRPASELLPPIDAPATMPADK